MSVHSKDRIVSFLCDDSEESKQAKKLLDESGLHYEASVGYGNKKGQPVMITALSRASWYGYNEIKVAVEMLLMKQQLG